MRLAEVNLAKFCGHKRSIVHYSVAMQESLKQQSHFTQRRWLVKVRTFRGQHEHERNLSGDFFWPSGKTADRTDSEMTGFRPRTITGQQ